MRDRRALSTFSRMQEIDELLDRRPGPGLEARPALGILGSAPSALRYGSLTIERPALTEWTGNQWGGFSTGEPTRQAVLVGAITPAGLSDWQTVHHVDGGFAIEGQGLGVAQVTIVGPNATADSGQTGGIAGASVTLTLANGQTWTGTTNGAGVVTFYGVAKSTGTLAVSAAGYTSHTFSVSTANNHQGVCAVSGGPFALVPAAIPSPIVVTAYSDSNWLGTGWVSGVTVVIKDPGGATVFSGATNASGQVSYTPATNGVHTVSIAAVGRYNPVSFNCTVNASGSRSCPAQMIANVAGNTYFDVQGLYTNPVKKTLTITDSVVGSGTATLSSGKWRTGFVSYSYPGSDGCQASSPKISYQAYWIRGKLNLDIFLAQSESVAVNGTNGGGCSAGGGGCPGTDTAKQVVLSTRLIGNFTEAGPPAFNCTFTLPSNWTKRADAAFKKLYGDVLPTYTIVEL